jgi:hypothetical protein
MNVTYVDKHRPMKRTLLIIFALTVSVFDGFADDAEVPSPLWLTLTKDVAFFFPAYAINLGVHEGGHALLARVFDPNVEFSLRLGRTGLLEGYVEYEDQLVPDWYRPWIAGAGTSFNVATALLSNLALETGSIPYHLQPLFSQVYLYGQLDFASNLTYAFLADCWNGFPNQATSNDFHNLVYFLSWDKTTPSKLLIYSGLATLLFLDLYLSRTKIARNWAVLTGERY